MGFSKRQFSIEAISRVVEHHGWKYLEEVAKKTEIFIFEDPESSKIIDLLLADKIDDAKQILSNYVLRISTKTSTDNR